MQLKKSILNKNHAVAILIFRCHLFPMSGCSHLEHLTKFCPSLLRSIEAALMEWLAGGPLHILPCPWNSWINNSTGTHLSIYRFLFILPAARHIAWWNWNWYMKAVKYLKYKIFLPISWVPYFFSPQ